MFYDDPNTNRINCHKIWLNIAKPTDIMGEIFVLIYIIFKLYLKLITDIFNKRFRLLCYGDDELNFCFSWY